MAGLLWVHHAAALIHGGGSGMPGWTGMHRGVLVVSHGDQAPGNGQSDESTTWDTVPTHKRVTTGASVRVIREIAAWTLVYLAE